MLPGMDGMAICATLRRERYPGMILMLTAKDALQWAVCRPSRACS
jgi:DNA-binding response OmpR family regulator